MRQKFSITVADVSMNIICDETAEIVNAAVEELDRQIRSLTSSGNSCTKRIHKHKNRQNKKEDTASDHPS